MSKPVDLANLKRVIELGCAECARDAGLENFAINVSVRELSAGHVIDVDLVTLTPELAAQLLHRTNNPNEN